MAVARVWVWGVREGGGGRTGASKAVPVSLPLILPVL